MNKLNQKKLLGAKTIRGFARKAMEIAHEIINAKEIASKLRSELLEDLNILNPACTNLERCVRGGELLRMQSLKELLEKPWIDSNIDVESKIREISQYTKSLSYDMVWLATIRRAREIIRAELCNRSSRVVINITEGGDEL